MTAPTQPEAVAPGSRASATVVNRGVLLDTVIDFLDAQPTSVQAQVLAFAHLVGRSRPVDVTFEVDASGDITLTAKAGKQR